MSSFAGTFLKIMSALHANPCFSQGFVANQRRCLLILLALFSVLVPVTAFSKEAKPALPPVLTSWQFKYPDGKQGDLITGRSPDIIYRFNAPRDIELLEIYGRFRPTSLKRGSPLFQIHLRSDSTSPLVQTIRSTRLPWDRNIIYVRSLFPSPVRIDQIVLRADPFAASQEDFQIRIDSVAVGRETGEKPRAKVLDFHPRTLSREIIWDFSGQGNSAWTDPVRGKNHKIHRGVLIGQITGEDDRIESPVLQDVRAGSFPFMEIRMKTDTAVGRGYLYWTTEAGQGISPKRRAGFRIKGSGKFRRYILHLSASPRWKGAVRQLTLVPLDHQGTFAVDSITLFNAPLLEFLWKHTTGVRKDILFYLALLFWLILLSAGRLTGRGEALRSWNQGIIRYGMICLLVCAVLFPFDFYPGLKISFLGTRLIPPAAVLFFFLLYRTAGIKKARPRSAPGRLPIDYYLIAFLLFACLSLLWPDGGQNTTRYLFQYYIPAGMAFFLSRGLSKEKGGKWRERLCMAGLGTGLFLSLNGLISFFVKSDLLYDHFYKIFAESYYQVPLQRISSALIHPTVLGSFLLFPLGVALAYILHGRQRIFKIFGFAGLLLILPAIFLTFSRGCWLCAAVVLLTFFKGDGWKRILVPLSAVTILLIITFFGSGYTREAFGKRVSVLEEESRHRLSGFFTAGRMGLSNPLFGAGPGSYPKHELSYRVLDVRKEQTTWKTPDNMYMRLFAETGFPGTGLFILFLFTALKKMRRAAREASWEDKPETTALWAASLGFSLNLLFFDGLYWFPPMLIFFLFLGAGDRIKPGNHPARC